MKKLPEILTTLAFLIASFFPQPGQAQDSYQRSSAHNISGETEDFSIFNNPSGSEIRVFYNNPETYGEGFLSIYDIGGYLVSRKKVQILPGVNVFKQDLPTEGVRAYLVRLNLRESQRTGLVFKNH